MDQDLGVALGPESMPPAFELAAQLLIVVDLAVEDDLDRAILVADGLIAAVQVDDREPPMDQPDPGSDQNPSASGPRWAIASPIAFNRPGSTGRSRSRR